MQTPFFSIIRNLRSESRLEFRSPTLEEEETLYLDSNSQTMKALIIENSQYAPPNIRS
jgi:hypothetical protein